MELQATERPVTLRRSLTSTATQRTCSSTRNDEAQKGSKASAALSQAIGSNSLLRACIKRHVSTHRPQQASTVKVEDVQCFIPGETIIHTRFKRSLLRQIRRIRKHVSETLLDPVSQRSRHDEDPQEYAK